MRYASVPDVEARVVAELSPDDRPFIRAMIDDATTVIEEYLGREFDENEQVPRPVRVVCARVAARAVSRAVDNPVGAEQQSYTAGPFSTSASYGNNSNSGGVFLTKQDKAMLRRFGGRRGAFTVRLY